MSVAFSTLAASVKEAAELLTVSVPCLANSCTASSLLSTI
jgi:hypothetical protein